MVDTFLGSRLVLSHDWIVEPVKKSTTVLTKWILFRGEKVFRLCLKDTTKTKNPILIFLAVNLNKLGLRVHEVRYSKQSLESSLMNGNSNGESLQFSFSICIVGSDSAYSYHLSDRLTKEQFWNASLKSQHHVDVEFVVKDKKFSAHKAVLAARSPVFAAEFTKEKPERKDDDGEGLQQIISIDDVDPASVEQFLYFLYTGEPIKSSLTNEQLLNLADRYQVITLVNLCRAALKNTDAQQMMSCLRNINPGAVEMHSKEAQFSNSVHMWPDKETEIFHDDATSVFHYPWEFSSISHALSPNEIKYQNENLFALHLSGNVKLDRMEPMEHPWIHLICANNHNFGFKAAKAFCSMDYYRTWMEMKPTRADVMELILFATQGSGSLEQYSRDRRGNYSFVQHCLYFRIEMTSNVENYHYEMMDTSWTTQLWKAALNQQLTDVEIIVGPIKLEAHRVILSARSPVLSALIDNNDQVKSSIVIDENMHIDVVKHFLKFLYTGCLEISATNKQLLELSKIYEVETLMKISRSTSNLLILFE